jgi:class 3 adenylate cyclase
MLPTPDSALKYSWKLQVNARARDIWLYLSDTSKMYRAAFMPKREFTEERGRLVVKQKLFRFFREEWIEEPWSWVFGRSINITRIYRRGMAKFLHVHFEVEEISSTQSNVTMNFVWVPSSSFWRLAIRASVPFQKFVTRYIFKKIENRLVNATTEEEKFEALNYENRSISQNGLSRLNKIRVELLEKSLSPIAIEKLCEWIIKGDELDVYRLQVKPLARRWQVEQIDLLKVCLHASRMGLLTISWDVICPHCRGVRFEAANLGSIPTGGDCIACDIDFKTDRLDAIEVTFHIHPSVREVKEIKFCAAEASRKTHIKTQHIVRAGQEALVKPILDEGHHRLRVKGKDHSQSLLVTKSDQNRIFWTSQEKSESELICGPSPIIHFRNNESAPVIFVVEEQTWKDKILLPAEVFLLKDFQDLFSEEHLHVDVRLSLGQQTILFTDIIGSTKFYEEVGDGKAFREVKNHFTEVFSVISSGGGCVVKTIGDSVMAVFHTPVDGVEAAVRIQKLFHKDRTDTHIRLRVSVHSGPVIAVHVHQGVDFFGSTVNLAAKLQACADAHEIALSEEVYRQYSEANGAIEHQVEKRSLKSTISEEPLDSYVLHVPNSPARKQTA